MTDPFADAGSIVRGADALGDGDGLLDVGETWTYTAAHTVTQAELDARGGDGWLETWRRRPALVRLRTPPPRR